eukprot:scaffold135641_cov68-Attheya_sp.AAC.3
MAVTKDLLLLAAGRRGLLSLPLNFGPEPKACVIPNNLGGWVWDVTVLDNVILGTGGTAFSGNSLGRHLLGGGYKK